MKDMTLSETLLPVVGAKEGYYVSDAGKVYRVDEGGSAKELTASMCKNGYYKVSYQRKEGGSKAEWLHRIVALAFVDNPNPEKFNTVNHIDENPANNRADNLEWCNNSYNMRYGKQFIRRMFTRKPVSQYTLDGDYIASYASATKAATLFGKKLNESHISDCCIGKRPQACGYIWRFKDETEPMLLNEYQALAARTINMDLSIKEIQRHALFGLCAEVGELQGIFQKKYQGHEINSEHVKKELSDIAWFLAEFCSANGWSLNDIAETNIAKLRARYPDGFDTDHSIHRRDGDI